MDDSVPDVQPLPNRDALLQIVNDHLGARDTADELVPMRDVCGAGGSSLLDRLLSSGEAVAELELEPHVVRWCRCGLQTVNPG